MSSTVYTIEEIRARIVPIAQKYPISRIYLFGSYARGEATKDSDIDLSVEYKPDMHITLSVLANMIEDFENSLGKHVDCVSEKYMTPEFLFNLYGEEVLLYE